MCSTAKNRNFLDENVTKRFAMQQNEMENVRT